MTRTHRAVGTMLAAGSVLAALSGCSGGSADSARNASAHPTEMPPGATGVPSAASTISTTAPPITGSPVDLPSATSTAFPVAAGGTFPVAAPPIPSLGATPGDAGAMTLRIAGAGEVSYVLGAAHCGPAGFDAAAVDASATVQLRDGTLRIHLRGSIGDITIAGSADSRSDRHWTVEGSDPAKGSAVAVQVSCA